MLAMPVTDEETGQLLNYRQLCTHPKLAYIWNQSYSNEMGRLFQGVGTSAGGNVKRVDGTDTFHIMHYNDTPQYRRK